MHVRFVVNILGTKNCTQSALKPHNKSPETRINAEFPSSIFLLKLGKSKTITKYICLSFISFLPLFHFCCIYYFGSLIFCCQFVAMIIPGLFEPPVRTLRFFRNYPFFPFYIIGNIV